MAVYAYWCLHNMGMKPSEFVELSENEMAFIIAAVDIYLERVKK